MATTIKQIDYYTIGTVEIAFPENDICCQNCELLTSDGLKRPKCRKTASLIYELYDVPDNCPVLFTGEIRGTRKEQK